MKIILINITLILILSYNSLASSGGGIEIIGKKSKFHNESNYGNHYGDGFNKIMFEWFTKNIKYEFYYVNNIDTSLRIKDLVGSIWSEDIDRIEFVYDTTDKNSYKKLNIPDYAIISDTVEIYTIELGYYKKPMDINKWIENNKNKEILKKTYIEMKKLNLQIFVFFSEQESDMPVNIFIKNEANGYCNVRYGFFNDEKSAYEFSKIIPSETSIKKMILNFNDFKKYWNLMDVTGFY